MTNWEKDLVVLVPDKDLEFTMRGILSRPQSLGIHPINVDIFLYMRHDPGCFRDGHDYLRSMTNRYAHAMVMFDRYGCGQENRTRDALEEDLTRRLSTAGWGERAAVIVLDPELEVWVWSDSKEVDVCLGWQGKTPGLRTWLTEQGSIV